MAPLRQLEECRVHRAHGRLGVLLGQTEDERGRRGAECPLASVVVGGLVTSTLLTNSGN